MQIGVKMKVYCKRLKGGDVKLWLNPKKDTSYILVNVENANKDEDGEHGDDGEKLDVDYFVRPHDSYDNKGESGWANRGGQDLVIMVLKDKARATPSCLPSPDTKDTEMKARLAGYGNYFREKCQADSWGPMKFHYSKTDTNCISNSCPPKFNDGLKVKKEEFLPIISSTNLLEINLLHCKKKSS